MPGYRFKHRLKVRFSEVDSAQIVFHAHFLNYLDIAVSEYFSEGLKLERVEMAKSGKFAYIVKKVTLEFDTPAVVNDWLNIWCKTVEMGNTSFVMRFLITRDGEDKPLLKAENVYVSYDFTNQATRPIPDFLRHAIEVYEGCAP
ncbi:Acyl-CoA thioester hydrolase YbgC [Pelotomaculum schinkii]|uniref:Acyl-CoA thioester hydrolase YbgC n=1 Tax=Pelotomaculum schinkii TaxID=78350 RepID=A0A4Y7REG6_9FIRM|nr:thioesterase family protein [Pelotomaculum schinkii]TEB07408.1 Acyl-CoA thioester hydrolase YbgC [Pelotomaculum schinkii]